MEGEREEINRAGSGRRGFFHDASATPLLAVTTVCTQEQPSPDETQHDPNEALNNKAT